jgi:hypothetical protein
VFDPARRSSTTEKQGAADARQSALGPVTKRAAERFPDLDESEAVTKYLDTAEGAEHYGRVSGS